jgi:hypothetical protein
MLCVQSQFRIGSAAHIAHNLYGPSTSLDSIWFSFVSQFSVYIDAAGKPSDGPRAFSVAAGFCSTVYAWEYFEAAWGEMLRKYQIPYLQMSMLHARKGFFGEDRWKDESFTAAFLMEVNQIIRSHVQRWSAAVIRYQYFEEICKTYNLKARFNPYAMPCVGQS